MTDEIVAINRFGWEATRIMFGWDLGRRCNYDCSYCPSHRHNTYSPHASLDELVDTFKKLSRYRQVMVEVSRLQEFTISLTGGEPASNPIFWDFCNEMRAIDPLIRIGLTSNGTMPERVYKSIGDYVNSLTISYHCEADPKLKKGVVDAMLYVHKNTDTYINCNIMFHSDPEYFQECLDLCLLLEENGVNFVPRIIGEDQGDIKKIKGDKEFHSYTKEQTEIFTAYYQQLKNTKNKASFKKSVLVAPPTIDDNPIVKMATRNEIGRPCCGGITFNTLTDDNLNINTQPSPTLNIDKLKWQETKYLQKSRFKDWYCLVHMYLSHIQQETRMIYAHQTCQANFDGRQGPICTIDTFDAYIDRIAQGDIPIIKCPNDICNCGLCTPKAKEKVIVEQIAKKLFTK